MKDIKGKNIAVLCDSVKKIEDMMNMVGYIKPVISGEARYCIHGENTCQNLAETNYLQFGSKDWYKENNYEIITFDEFAKDIKYSTEEILGWLMNNYSDDNSKYADVFGSDYYFSELVESFAPSEIIRRVSAQIDKENQLTTISKSFYDKIAKEQLDKLYPNGWKVEE